MRKAQGLARSRSRRKGGQQNGPGGQPGNAGGNGPPNANGPGGGGGGGGGDGGQQMAPIERRKPTPEEAALTAKNYRLAKELSELRVRHRDETKTVTRLTMENMNLASRCREAITHVAMLKKELLAHQRRADEAMAGLQRQQQSSQSDLQQAQQQPAQMSSLDAGAAVGAAIASPPPPPPTTQPPSASRRQQVSPDNVSPELPKQEEKDASPPPSFVSGGANRVLAAKAAREKVQKRKPVEDFAEEEVPADEMQIDEVTRSFEKEDFFGEEPGRPAQHLPATPEKEDVVLDTFPATASAEAVPSAGKVPAQPQKRKIHKGVDPDIGRPPSPVFSNTAMVKARTEMSTMSSIDAFEASFDTTFPTSFQSAQKEGPAPSLDISFDVPEFSDPFYLGSDGDGGNISFDSRGPPPANGSTSGPARPVAVDTGAAARGYSGTHPQQQPTFVETQTQTQKRHTPTAGRVKSASPANSGFSPDLFPSSPMSDLKQMPNEAEYVKDDSVDELGASFPNARNAFETPAVNGSAARGASPQAPGPEKTGAAAARARYDAALGPAKVEEEPRPKANAPKSPGNAASIASKRELSNSASLVLKRLQQRRAKNGGSESPSNSAQQSATEQEPEMPPQNENVASGSSQFSPYGGTANTEDAKASDKLTAIRSSARRLPTGEASASKGIATVVGDYGPKRRTAKPYSSENHAMFKATNPSPVNTKYRTATRPSGHRLSPNSMNAEMNELDAIAAQANAASAAASAIASPSSEAAPPAPAAGRRLARAVKQPVSYAEPSLNAKIRKGHEFFPKNDTAGAAATNGPSTRVVSPGSSLPHRPSSEAALM